MAWHGYFPGAGEPSYMNSSQPPLAFTDLFQQLVSGLTVGDGVDHSGTTTGAAPRQYHPNFPFGAHGGRRARAGACPRRGGPRHRQGPAESRAPARDSENPEPSQDPREVAPESADPEQTAPPHRGAGCHGRHGRGRRSHHHHHPAPPFPFDPSTLAELFNHPLAQTIRDWAVDQAGGAATAEAPSSSTSGSSSSPANNNTFTPPLDLFETETEYVLHLALPGARKQDIGVDWDAEKGELGVAGVVHRPGDEEFLRGMRSSERRVGVFERSVRLPPVGGSGERKDEVDGEGISAKMEDGLLVITVPKMEKDGWTEVRKVDVE